MKAVAAVGLILLGAGLAACSLLNGFEDLRLVPESSTAAAGGAAGSGGEGGGEPDASSSSSSSSKSSSSSTSGVGGSTPAPEPVMAVAGAFLGQDVLYVLDVKTGKALLQETALVAAIRHVPLADAFFVFGAGSLPVGPENRGQMSVRRFDRNAKPEPTWNELSRIENILLPRRNEDVAVLRNRIAYLVEGLSAPTSYLSVLNTQNSSNVRVLVPEVFDVTPLQGDTLTGLVGVETFGDGGVALIVYRREVGGGNCQLALRRVELDFNTVNVDSNVNTFGPLYSCNNAAAWAVDKVDSQLMFAIPSTEGGRLIRYQPSSGDKLDERAFTINGGVSRLTMEMMQCERVAVVANTGTANTLSAVPLFGTANFSFLSHPFDFVSIDPVAQRVLYGFRKQSTSPPFIFDARGVVGSCTDPKLTAFTLNQFKPPIYLEPSIVEIASTEPLVCPMDCTLPEN